MALPSRVFVGVTVFGLIVSLLVVPYTAIVLAGYHPRPDSPYEVLFPPDDRHDAGDKAFLVASSLFCLLMVAYGWRSLVRGARRDAAVRQARSEKAPTPKDDAAARAEREPQAPPPGYQ